MSVFPKENIRNVAESLGLSVKDDVTIALAQDVEYRLHEVLQEAIKFMNHSNRTKLNVQDINNALRLKNVEPLYGFGSGPGKRFRKTMVGVTDVYFMEDEELDLEAIMNAPLPKVPLDVTYTAHWLAIEGVQPAIPQNPAPLPNVASGSKSTKQISPSNSNSSTISSTITAAAAENNVQVKPLVKHVLSKELQLYYERVTNAVLSTEQVLRGFALNSLSLDPGLHQLLPYFVLFIGEKITKNMKDLQVLDSILSMVESILENRNLFVEPYLHQLMPAVVSCVVGRRVGDPSNNTAASTTTKPLDHWTLRTKAAQLIADICHRFGRAYSTLQPRVTRTLLRAFLDPTKPLTTQFGGLTGLGMLGNEVVKVLVFPNVKSYGENLEKEMAKARGGGGEVKEEEPERCYRAVMTCIQRLIAAESTSMGRISSSGGAEGGEGVKRITVHVLREKYGNLFGDGLNKELKEEEKRILVEVLSAES